MRKLAALLSFLVSFQSGVLAQECFTLLPRFYDQCNGTGYYPARAGYIVEAGNKTYLLVMRNFDVAIFGLDNPSQPIPKGSLTMPFPSGCGLPFGCGDSHFQYIGTLRDFSVEPTTGYAFVPLSNMGWDMLKITGSGVSWVGTGFHGYVPNAPYVTGVLFAHQGQLYLVGQKLDPASVAANDPTVRIYPLGSTPAPDLYQSLPQGPALPLGELQSAPMGSIRLYLLNAQGRRYVVAYRGGANGVVTAADVTDPANPVFGGSWPRSQYGFLFQGVWAVDPARSILWVANAYQPSAVPTLYRIPVTVAPGSLNFGPPQAFPWHTQAGVAPTTLAVSNDLLWVSSAGYQWAWRTAVFKIDANGQLTRLPDQEGVTEFFPGQECPLDVTSYAILAVGNQRYVYRTASKDAAVITVDPSCLATTPTAGFTVTNQNQDQAAAADCGGADADGFPGDTFLFTDTSAGQISYKNLKVCPNAPGCSAPVFSSTWTQTNGWQPPLSWATPPTSSGLFVATLTVGNGQDPDSAASRTIRLCDNPQAALSPNGGSHLQNTTVQLSAAGSQGHPNSYDFVVWPPETGSPTITPSASGSFNLALSACGTYQVALIAHYAHAGTDSGCGPWYSDANPGTYDSCTPQVTFVSGAAKVTFVVKQNGGETTAPMVGAPTVVEFTGQWAPGYTPTFQWSATTNNGPVTVPGLSDCSQATCTIQPNTLTAGSTYTFTLTLGLSPDPGTCAPPPVSKSVTPTTASASFQFQNASGQPITQAAVGQTVRLKLTSYQGVSLSALRFRTTDNAACDGSTEFPLCPLGGNCPDFVSVSFRNTPSTTVELVLSAPGGDQVLDTKTLTLTSGTCPSSCTYSLSPANQSFPATGGTGSFSVNTASGCPWSASSSAPWVQITSGASGTGPGTVSFSVAVNTGAARSGAITVASQNFSIFQAGASGGGGGGGGGNLTITANPSQISSFPTTVMFSFSPPLAQSGDTLTFNFGDGSQQTLTPVLGSISQVPHTYSAPPAGGSAFAVSASGTIGGTSYSGSVQVTVVCSAQAAPVAEFSWEPVQPRAGNPVHFTDQSTGGPTSWQWSFGLPLGGGTSTERNPTFVYSTAGTYTVTLTASNCKGSSTKQKQITVLPACGETAVPVADFTWQPAEPTEAQVCQTFPSQCQKQPYAGQKVKLVDASSNNPTDWHWYDFQELRADFRGQATVTVQWNQPGPKNVRLKARNCVGESAEKLKTVTVHPDERPVTAAFTCSASPAVGQPVTCTAEDGFLQGNPTSFTWTIEDPKPGAPNPVTLSGKQITYTFQCGGKRKVTLQARRGSFSGSSTQELEVSGSPCGPAAFVAADAAKGQGLNNTFWRTDLRLFNPSAKETKVHLDVLRPGQSNADPPGVTNLPLPPLGVLVLDDVLSLLRPVVGDVSKASIRVRFDNPDGVPPVVVGRTYTDVPGGGTFGQLIPAAPAPPLASEREQWITGIRHDGTGSEGFRTNVSLYNLRADRDSRVDLYLYDAQGQPKGAVQGKSLAPLGYEQAPLASLFNLATPPGVAALRLVLGEGSQVGVNASIVDNRTGDGSLQTNEPKPTGGTLVIPGVSHAAGAAGSTWRSTVVLTNPDAQVHRYVLKLVPKGLPSLEKPLTLQAGETRQLEDVVAWIADPFPVPEASGVLLVSPDGGAFPAVSARTYNLAADGGTYGQTLKVFHAGNSAGGSTGYRKLYLTGMSSEDIARSNLGFVHVGGDTVNFKVWFYDETGRLLNPDPSTPYTLALNAENPWDQDKLENRFRNKGWTLPANLRAISAVIQVEGGLGQAYASVVDNRTNDPIFIPAVPAP